MLRQGLTKTIHECRGDSSAPWGSQKKGAGGCLAAAWHYASLGFAEHPLRKHREWTGSVVPYNTLEARHSRSGSRANGDAYDEEAAAFAGAVPAKRQLFLGCGMALPEQPPRTYGISLFEQTAASSP